MDEFKDLPFYHEVKKHAENVMLVTFWDKKSDKKENIAVAYSEDYPVMPHRIRYALNTLSKESQYPELREAARKRLANG